MRKVPDVNDQLLGHLCRGGGISIQIRDSFKSNNYKSWFDDLLSFFDADDDYSKIVFGRKIAELLLARHNMQHLVNVRDMVAEYELKRLANYKKQTDHTVHTILLCFLGIYIFDNSLNLRKIYSKINLKQKYDYFEAFRRFPIQWIISSLLHDIGYIFESISFETRGYFKEIDGMFECRKLKGMRALFPNADNEAIKSAMNIIRPKLDKWKNLGELPCYGNCNSPIDITFELEKCPWMDELFPGTSNHMYDYLSIDISGKQKAYPRPTGKYIKRYAMNVAKNGYVKGDAGVVDHGYGSGCLVAQLTSFRYWVFDATKKVSNTIFENLSKPGDEAKFPGFSYNKEALFRSIFPGCHAAACHNILPVVAPANKALPFKLKNNVLLFLSTLCDELQKWNRPPMGKKYLTRPFRHQPVSSKEFYLEGAHDFFDGYINFGINNAGIANNVMTSVIKKADYNDISKFMSFSGEAGKKIGIDRLKELLQQSRLNTKKGSIGGK